MFFIFVFVAVVVVLVLVGADDDADADDDPDDDDGDDDDDDADELLRLMLIMIMMMMMMLFPPCTFWPAGSLLGVSPVNRASRPCRSAKPPAEGRSFSYTGARACRRPMLRPQKTS